MRHVQWLLLPILLCPGTPTRAGSITTPEIISQTSEAAFACMQWTPVGLCFWLQCSPLGCELETSLKVGHYNPDFVVSSYNELGQNPWQEMQAVFGPAQRTAANDIFGRLLEVPVDSSGNRTEGTTDHRQHKNLIFRETEVIGHPLTFVADSLDQYFCGSQAEPYTPYFLSGLDAWSWRRALPEILYPASFTPGLREMGAWPLQTWGPVFPRTGWSIQAEEPKAAALIAQRAGDIVTRPNQPHIYIGVSDSEFESEEQRIWPPEPLVETDARTGTWQMLLPVTDADCAVFGTNDLDSTASWSDGRVDEAGDYVWNLWRPYQCCERAGQQFLFDINWIDYPE